MKYICAILFSVVFNNVLFGQDEPPRTNVDCGEHMQEKLQGNAPKIDWKEFKISELTSELKKEIGIALTRLDEIANQSAAPTVENTLQAFLNSQEKVEHISKIFSTLQSNMLDDELKAIQNDFEAASVDFGNKTSFHDGFFKRLKTLKKKFPKHPAVTRIYNDFIRSGADLPQEKKDKLAKINQKLKELSTQFGNNHLHRLKELKVIVTNKNELDGLPEATIKRIEKDGKYIINFRDSTVSEIMMFCTNRKLREKVTYATAQPELASKYLSKEELGDTKSDDNRPVVLEIVKTRKEHAKLMGYANHAEYQLADRMAKDPKTALRLTMKILEAGYKKSKVELKELADYAKKKDRTLKKLEPWDVSYFSALYEKEFLDFNESEFKKYFEFQNTFKATLDFIGELYNVQFTEDPKIKGYHPDVKAFHVKDLKLGKEIGVLFVDPFTREIKHSGAWANNVTEQGKFSDGMRRPIASVHFNFDPPHGNTSTLLKVSEVETILHEMGHAMHALFSDVEYRNLGGFNVPWDFVEFPSTVMENWLSELRYLELASKHIESGKVIPAEWLGKIKKKQDFQKAMVYMRTASFAYMDLIMHSAGIKPGEDLLSFEKRTRGAYSLFPEYPFTLLSPRFSHLFNGGYSAGYYSYLWSETIEADGFYYWNESSKTLKARSHKLRDKILSRGGSLDANIMYKSWRGRNFTTDAFFKKNGLK
ncbi:MAG: M3 family metallopeptidase [Xanthomonadaceae bacterium]|nr:M3 family metallopeptidase [Xanthomonadaceae bacterium]